MDEVGRDSVRKSRDHWSINVERKLANQHMRIDARDCMCCHYTAALHFDSFSEWQYSANKVKCDGCPIRGYTGMQGCNGTPYYAVINNEEEPEVMVQWLDDLYEGREPRIWERRRY